MRTTAEGRDHRAVRVEKIMTRDVLTVAPDTSLRVVALLLSANHVSGLPVCAPDGSVLGVVSEADILRKEEGFPTNPGRLSGWLLRKIDGELDKISARTAGEAMTAPALTARPGQQVSDVARLMTLHKINRLPVVSEGRLVGIVSRADLVRAFHRSDEELEREIRDEVLWDIFLLPPEAFRLTVEGGVVTIRGTVRTAADAESVARCLRGVPGVLEVKSELVAREIGSTQRMPLPLNR
jgi:CBS domain-containing protein